jgi:hypothetical protein
LAWALVVLAVVAGVGWLYILRDARALAVGPLLDGALPLQQLAGGSAQPLLRMAVAWLPGGLAAGLALRLTGARRVVRLVGLAVVAAVVLIPTGAVSDAIAVNEPVASHVVPALTRSGTWAAVALFVIGALPFTWPAPPRARGGRAAASAR